MYPIYHNPVPPIPCRPPCNNKKWSEGIEVGKFYEAKVVHIVEFGVFVKIFPDREGVIYNSELDTLPGADPRKLLRQGEIIRVKCIHIDEERHRLLFSRKEAIQQKRQMALNNYLSGEMALQNYEKFTRPRILPPRGILLPRQRPQKVI